MFAKRDGRGRKRPGANEKKPVEICRELETEHHLFSAEIAKCVQSVGKQEKPETIPKVRRRGIPENAGVLWRSTNLTLIFDTQRQSTLH